jgi:hypothetical protein
MRENAMGQHDFERFYYTKVALGEGCGCAEYVTRMRDLDRLSAKGATRGVAWEPEARPPIWFRLANWLGKTGLRGLIGGFGKAQKPEMSTRS